MELESRVQAYIRSNHLLADGDAVTVALSGGADSVTLLLVLRELGYDVSAVHVNHCLRGAESDGDEQFVRDLCRRLGVPVDICTADVGKMAREMGTGVEETGRLVRHRAFLAGIRAHGASCVAAAHHANDQAETFFFHAARGSSLRGLAGIRPVQQINVQADERYRGIHREPDAVDFGRMQGRFREIRPLLCVSKTDIEAFLRARCQGWRTDSSNLTHDGARNGIRNDVIPYFERQINRETVLHISEAAEDLAAADDFLQAEAQRRAAEIVSWTGETETMADHAAGTGNGMETAEVFISDRLTGEPGIMQGYILLYVLARMAGSAKDIGRTQVRQMQELFRMRSGSRVSLPYGLEAVRDYRGVSVIQRTISDAFSCVPSSDDGAEGAGAGAATGGIHAVSGTGIPIAGSGTYFWGEWKFVCTLMRPEQVRPDEIRQMTYTKFFNYDKMKQNLVIRNRCNGDRIQTQPGGRGKKLSDYMIDEKIPARERDRVPLLASGHRVFWVVGHRISAESKVTGDTSEILCVRAVRTTAGAPTSAGMSETGMAETADVSGTAKAPTSAGAPAATGTSESACTVR